MCASARYISVSLFVCVWDCIEHVPNVRVLNVCCMLFVCWNTFVWVSPFYATQHFNYGLKAVLCLAYCWGERKKEWNILLYSNIQWERKRKIQFCPCLPCMKDKFFSLVFRGHTHIHTPSTYTHSSTYTHKTLPPINQIIQCTHSRWSVCILFPVIMTNVKQGPFSLWWICMLWLN